MNEYSSGLPISCPECGQFLLVPQGKLGENLLYEDYILGQKLNQGRVGDVFIAQQRSTRRHCALRIIQLDDYEGDVDEAVTEMRRQHTVTAPHQHILTFYEMGRYEDSIFFSFEYVTGKSLKTLLEERGSLTVNRSLDVALEMVSGLRFAWNRHEVVHGDLTLANVFVNEDGICQIADMGISGFLRDFERADQLATERPEDTVVDDMKAVMKLLFHCITGQEPDSNREKALTQMDNAKELIAFFRRAFSEGVFSTYEELQRELTSLRWGRVRKEVGEQSTVMDVTEKVPRKPARKHHLLIAVISLMLAISGAGAFHFLYGGTTATAANSSTLTEAVVDENSIFVTELLIDPKGFDPCNEVVVLENQAESGMVKLEGWIMRDSNTSYELSGQLKAGERLPLTLTGAFHLNNGGKTFELLNSRGHVLQRIKYFKEEVVEGAFTSIMIEKAVQ